jgi:hypothetical protein
VPKTIDSRKLIDDDCGHKRKELHEPEQEFLLRLHERHGESVDRHAILHCVLGDLKSYSDLKPFLDFEQKQTTAPEKLKNPAGHYRRTVGKFYEARAKRRDWDIRSQMRALEKKVERSAGPSPEPKSVLWHVVTEPANAGTKLVLYRPALAKSGNRYRRRSSPRSSR